MFDYLVAAKILPTEVADVQPVSEGEDAQPATYRDRARRRNSNADSTPKNEWKTGVTEFLSRVENFNSDIEQITDHLSSFRGLEKDPKCQMICNVAKAILCIPAQSASSERVFSRLKLVVYSLRTRLSGYFAGQLVKSSLMYTQKERFERIEKKS